MPGTYRELQESFDQVVPGAAGHADTFLGVIQRRCHEAGLGLELMPVRVDRRQDRVVMRGSITFGNAWKGKRPYLFDVYADEVGPALQVGWQLSTDEFGGVLGNTNMGYMVRNAQATVANDPNTIRQLTGILQAFQQMVFLPTLQDLIDATDVQRPANGFLGA
jgi:hypothetical protein